VLFELTVDLVTLTLFAITVGLPAAIWFARDAYVARLNPWVWGIWGVLSVGAPIFAVFALAWFMIEPPWTRRVDISAFAAGWITASIIYKRFLRPKRLAMIGTSLNYVGGWLGTLILWLVASALAYFVLYLKEAKKEIEYFCREERTWQSFIDCIISFRLETLGTAVTIICVTVTLTGFLLAALTLCYRTPYAVRITGYLLVLLFLFKLVNPIVHQVGDQMELAKTRGTSSNPFSMSVTQTQTHTQNVLPELVWLVYLVRSKRVREVFGRNFGRV
jgi:hypothetical protein